MKAQLPHTSHASYLRHQKERNLQIFLPVILSAITLIALIALLSYATFNKGGDVSRWAAVSTIWLILPMLLGGLVVLALLIALIYGMARLLGALPHYTSLAQDYVHLAQARILHGANTASTFLIDAEERLAKFKAFFKRMMP
ncbi:MAG: hypothetical protein Fur002_14540 [Anaerolineales bacterium]